MAALWISEVTLEIPLLPYLSIFVFLQSNFDNIFFIFCLLAFLFMIKKAMEKLIVLESFDNLCKHSLYHY